MNIRLASSLLLIAVLNVSTAAWSAEDRQMQRWMSMQREVVSARDVLNGEVSSGFSPIGEVRDLVLTPDSKRVQYVLYEVPYPYSFFGDQDGFVAFDKTTLDRGARLDVEVRIDEPASRKDPDELTLSASEADRRLAERLLGRPMQFPGDQERNVEDMLIEPGTGRVSYYVIASQPDSLFNEMPMAVPADRVAVSPEGRISSDLALEDLSGMQLYPAEML
jgi:hypothetical protein